MDATHRCRARVIEGGAPARRTPLVLAVGEVGGEGIETRPRALADEVHPVWIEDGEYLLFSDVPQNRIYLWKEGTGHPLIRMVNAS